MSGTTDSADLRFKQVVQWNLSGRNRLQQQVQIGARLKLFTLLPIQQRLRPIAGLARMRQHLALRVQNRDRAHVSLAQRATGQGSQLADVV